MGDIFATFSEYLNRKKKSRLPMKLILISKTFLKSQGSAHGKFVPTGVFIAVGNETKKGPYANNKQQ